MSAKESWKEQFDRPFWKDDDEFMEFNNKMLSEKATFEEILELSTLKNLPFKEEIDWNEIKRKWNPLVEEWNTIRGETIEEPLKAIKFVGLTYLINVFPFDKLTSGDVFAQHEVEILTVITFYNKQKYLPFKNMPELLNCPPYFPPAYEEWINRKYDSASWWATYIVYERRKGLLHLINPEERAVLLS